MSEQLENFGLLHPVYPIGVVKLPLGFMEKAKLPGICPHCLKPGDITETFKVTFTTEIGYNQRQIQTISIPLQTHAGCSRGFTKRNISGSVRIWGERSSGFVGQIDDLFRRIAAGQAGSFLICFDFKNPVFSLLFSRINFQYLLNHRGQRLLALFENEYGIFKNKPRHKFTRSCPLCDCGLSPGVGECPSCGLDIQKGVDLHQRITFDSIDVQEQIDKLVGVAKKCPSCGIIMLKDSDVQSCPRCEEDL